VVERGEGKEGYASFERREMRSKETHLPIVVVLPLLLVLLILPLINRVGGREGGRKGGREGVRMDECKMKEFKIRRLLVLFFLCLSLPRMTL